MSRRRGRFARGWAPSVAGSEDGQPPSPRVAKDAVFRPTVREFLVTSTGVEDWPSEVNIYPYEKLAREKPAEFVRSYETFRRTGQALTTDALILVGASAVLGVDLFDITSPLLAMELAFHADDRWQKVAEYFNQREQIIIRSHLRQLPPPFGDLFGDKAEIARSAVVALLVLKQHFDDSPGKQLPFLSPALASYRECDLPPIKESPTWLVEDEIPRFEKLLGKEFKDHIRDTLNLKETAGAYEFVQRERLSRELRSLVPFDVPISPRDQSGADDDFRLDRLVPEFLQMRRDIEMIVASTKSMIENLRLTPVKNQTAQHLLHIFVDKEFYRVDRLCGRIDNLIYFIEGPARRQWQSVAGFEDRWATEVRAARDAMALARRLLDEIDMAYRKLLEARYDDIVPAEIMTTNMFYEKFIAPRRRTDSARPKKAVVLLIDSMRLDFWRELLRPALERDYEVEETIGFALLPSETHFSRRAFFAGKPPRALPTGGQRETDLFAELVSAIHGRQVIFEELPDKRPGMRFSVQTTDSSLHVAVFDFADVMTHKVDWDPHTVQETQRHLLTEIRALLAKVGTDALVFITSDHGHLLQKQGRPVDIHGIEDVGYRAALVPNQIQGVDAAHLFQIKARTLGHASNGWFVFPRPGYALRGDSDTSRRFRPNDNYRHGGLSLFEVLVPVACLKHRMAKARARLVCHPVDTLIVGRAAVIEIGISADSVLTSPVTLITDNATIEVAVVSGVNPTPQTTKLRYLPEAPGKHAVRVTAQLGGEKIGEATFDLQVSPAPTEPDAARAKLNKLFGDK